MGKTSGLKKLERRLGFGAVVAISISAMLGSGIFVLPGMVVAQTGPSAWLAYFFAALCVLPAALSKSELATAMPSSGGTYVYIERTFGPLAGTVAGLGLCLSLLLKSAFALVGFGAYLSVLANVPLLPMALLLLLIITVLNILGVGKISSAVMVIVAVSLVGIISLSVVSMFNFDYSHFDNFLLNGHLGLMEATSLVFIAFAGVTKVAAIAGEVKDPEKNLPKGILTSLLLVTIVYCVLNFVMLGQLSVEELSYNLKPVHTLAEKVGGEILGIIAALVAVVTMTSMANAGLLAASRFPFAMGRDDLLPSVFGRLNPRSLTPVVSILASSLIIAVAILLLDVGKIVKLASAFMLMIYMVENVAVILLRELRVQWYKPQYVSPFYPWVQLFGILSGMALLLSMGMVVIPALASIAIPGVLLFFFYSRKRSTRLGVLGIRGKRLELMGGSIIDENRKLPELEEAFDANTVVVLFGNERSPEMVVEMGMALRESGELEVVQLYEVPEQTDLDDVLQESSFTRSLKRRIDEMAVVKKQEVRFDPIVSHDLLKSIYDISQSFHCKWLVKEWGGKTRGTFTLNNQIGWLRNHLPCHMAIFRDAGIRYIKKIMVVLHLDNDNDFVSNTAEHLASVHGADIAFVAYLSTKSSDEDVRAHAELLNKICFRYEGSSQQLLRGKKEGETLLAETVEYDLLVLGVHPIESLQDQLFGTKYDKIVAKASCSVVSIQQNQSK